MCFLDSCLIECCVPAIIRCRLRVIIKNGTKSMMTLAPLVISGCKGDYSCTGIFFTRRSWRPPSKVVVKKASMMVSAVLLSMKRPGMNSTLESL